MLESNNQRIYHDTYRKIQDKPIGSPGSFGSVYLVENIHNNRKYKN